MYISRLSLFRGKPIRLNENIKIYSPTIDEIEEITENTYNLYLLFATFNLKNIISVYNQINIINNDILEELKEFSEYEILTSVNFIIKQIVESLSFFVKDDVFFNLKQKTFIVKDTVFITKDNYKDIVKIIKTTNGLAQEEKEVKYRNEVAKKMHQKLLELRKKYRKNDYLELKDYLSILCNAPDNGINVFNVGNLTIYQVYEHLERLGITENYKRLLGVWQNGLLKDSNQLKDWMIRTTL